MGIQDDRHRFHQVREENRMDLSRFIQTRDLKPRDDTISVPITIANLPEFVYAKQQRGGIAQGEGAEPGDPIEDPDGEPGEGDEAGEGSGEHGYYDMDPEEFAEQLDEEFDLDLDPKGKQVETEAIGGFSDTARTGPDTMLDVEHLFKQSLKRSVAMSFDEEYLRSLLQVRGWGPDSVFEWARGRSVPVSKAWVEATYDNLEATTVYDDPSEIDDDLDRTPDINPVADIQIRRDDEQYRYPEMETTPERNVVVINLRDVSGSMHGQKEELVERTFTPLDWYLQGKYDSAHFHYVVHDSDAMEVEREDFFQIRSGGGTRVSSAYEVVEEIFEDYPYSQWNRYVFGAGDGGNALEDTETELLPLMNNIDVNLHGYVEVGTSKRTNLIRTINDYVEQPVATANVPDRSHTAAAVETILGAASDESTDNDS